MLDLIKPPYIDNNSEKYSVLHSEEIENFLLGTAFNVEENHYYDRHWNES